VATRRRRWASVTSDQRLPFEHVGSVVDLRRLAEVVQNLSVQLLALVPELLLGRPDDELAGAVQKIAVLCAIEARAIDPIESPPSAAYLWRPSRVEELLALAQLALTLAEQDLLSRTGRSTVTTGRPQ